MTKKILIAGFACWSVIAVAQSSGSKDQAASAAQTKDAHPKEAATGQATGRVAPMHNGLEGKMSSGQPAITENKKLTSAQPAITENKKTASAQEQNGNGQVRVAAGDVNGDGKADVTATSSSNPKGQVRVAAGDVNGDGKADAAINNSHSNIKNTKDAGSGQTSGKRMHGDITVTKGADAAPQK